jgi:hypothetical protein
MSKWTKRFLIAAMIAVPTLGYAVTKYRKHHKSCPVKAGHPCPLSKE